MRDAFLTDCHMHPYDMCQPLFNVGSGLNCVNGGPTRLMNIRLDKITVNNWSIQKEKQRERRSRCIKKNWNGVPMRSRPTRTLVDRRVVASVVYEVEGLIDASPCIQ